MNVTLKHVAKKAGLSWQTVSKVLNDQGHLFRPETRDRVVAAAREMGYVPNAAARMMRTQQTRHIGLLLRNEESHRYHNLAAFILLLGINTRLEKEGYLLSVVRYGDVQRPGHSRSRVFEERVLDGLIALGGFSPEVFDWVTGLIPNCIWVDTDKWEPTCCLQRDEVQVGQLIAKHVLNMGYRQVVWAGAHPDKAMHYSLKDRYNSLKAELNKQGVDLETTSVMSRPDNCLIYHDLLKHLQPDRVIVAYNVHAAQGVLVGGASMGLTPNRDFGLICCDETPEIYESWPGLCRVSHDRFDMGYQAADMMLQLLQKPASPPDSRILKNRWVIGNTAWGPVANPMTNTI